MLTLKDDFFTTKRTNNTTNVKLLVCFMEGSPMLNFLYKVPLITRIFTTNVKVGRKYAKNEQVS